MRKKNTKLITALFIGLFIVFNSKAQDATFNSFPTGWTTSSVNAGLENECKLSIATGTVSPNTTYLSASASPSYILVSLPNATSTTIDKVSIEVLANNTTAGKYGICAYSTDNSTWTDGAQFALPVNTGATSTYTYTAPTNAKYYKAGRAASGTVLGGVTLSAGGATVRFYSIKVWLKSSTPSTPTITAFSASGVSATIDQNAKTITAVLPYGTNLTSITPTVTIGGSATSYSPTGAKDFSAGAVTYTATDGTTSSNYAVTLTANPTASSDKDISNLKISTYTPTFDSGTNTYSLILPKSSSTNQAVTFTIPSTATADFTSGNTHDFTTPLTITVTAQDNSTKVYTVNASVASKNIAYIINTAVSANDTKIRPELAKTYYLDNILIGNVTTATDFSLYDLVILTESPSTGSAGMKALWGINKPLLALKMFAIQANTWNLATASNPTTAATTATIFEPNHPIFAGITPTGTYGVDISMIGSITSGNGLQVTNYATDYLLAGISGSTSPSIVEIPVGVTSSMTGVTNAALQQKLLIVGISDNNQQNITSNGLTIVKNACTYLMGATTWGSTPEVLFKNEPISGGSSSIVQETTARITWSALPGAVSYTITSASGPFAVKGNRVKSETNLIVDGASTSYDLTGLTANTDYTFSITGQNSAGASSTAGTVMFKTKNTATSVSNSTIEGVSFDGKNILNPQKINLSVFDLSGRFILNSNQDINMSNKAKGIYIIKSDKGIMKIAVK